MPNQSWSIADSAELYLIDKWGAPYFAVNAAGHLCFHSDKGQIDLKHLVDDLCRRGIGAPMLLRLNDILRMRIALLYDAFAQSIASYDYRNIFRCVMPIKVNQQRHVIEQIVKYGKQHALGLEAGSKPELLVAMALLEGQEGATLVCNGYKDREYIEMALAAQTLGIKPYIVLDRFAELELVIQASKQLKITPNIGIRARLSTRGSGRWRESSGEGSKFGLSAREMVEAVRCLQQEQMLDALQLLHFHIGSQITAIRAVKDAVREASHLYCQLRHLGADNLNIVDCGGGLAVDYDGSQTNFHSSKNYSIQEYANDIVAIIQHTCDLRAMPHPLLMIEAGRALVAHHSVLIFNVLGISSQHNMAVEVAAATAAEHDVVQRMWETYQQINQRNFQESHHDILALKEESTTLFGHGLLDLPSRARTEELFWATCHRIAQITQNAAYVSDDLRSLDKDLADTYYCNFSVFQSLPDAWAIGQLFPVAPLHRLDEEPNRKAVIADLTCDSDGKINRFIGLRDVQDTLLLHKSNGKPYYLGAFLVGAYQEILGDLHNLFGDTNAVHMEFDADGRYHLEHLVAGDNIADVLGYVEYERSELVRRVRQATETAVRSGRLSLEQSAQLMKRYEQGLLGYTYLEDID